MAIIVMSADKDMPSPRTLLSLAGYDPSAGAGLLLDVSVFQRLGFHGIGVITALTVQNTRKVGGVYVVGARQVNEQYRTMRKDLALAGLKVGMVGSLENLRLIGRILTENSHVPRVVDPVFRSGSGAWLLEPRALSKFLASIKGRVTVLTPNLNEASLLTGRRVRTPDDMGRAAKELYERSGVPCLVKGGHLQGSITDVLYDGRSHRLYRHGRSAKDVHGTGCFLSASLLGFLADGYSLPRACGLAIGLTQRAIRKARRPGRGRSVIGFPL
jgi:hydroxymethylpyrimidine/phosphomethylpyrimidine kinase